MRGVGRERGQVQSRQGVKSPQAGLCYSRVAPRGWVLRKRWEGTLTHPRGTSPRDSVPWAQEAGASLGRSHSGFEASPSPFS